MSERETLQRLRSGEHAAFETLFRAHYAGLVGLADSIVRDRGAAEELAQDVMLELWRRRETLAIETTVKAYLFRAARNRALNWVRHQRTAERLTPPPDERGPFPPADVELLEGEIQQALREAVSTLPERCRQVFELSRVHGLTYPEIAQSMEISVKTVEAQMGKALRVLRERLGPFLHGREPDSGA